MEQQAIVRVLRSAIVCVAVATPSLIWAQKAAKTQEILGCIHSASLHYSVNSTILEAIIRVESSLRPDVVHKPNKNNTEDFGIAGINSIHLDELSKWGIGPAELRVPCVGVYVGAWHLSNQHRKYGNTWYAVGAYHSRTPEHNQKYQRLVYQMVQKMSGSKAPM
jgi:soluble lytic murein transglycosylase-like protein